MKHIYYFEEGKADMRKTLGGKGANLAEMTRIGLPVPPGFTITADTCIEYQELGGKFPEGLEEDIVEHLKGIEEKTGKRFGDSRNPLLVSVRSGAAISMPGMMDTILNLGLNDTTVQGFAEATQDKRFAYDCYRRFIQMFGNVVMKIEHDEFEKLLEAKREEAGVKFDNELSPDDLFSLIGEYKRLFREKTGRDFPQEPKEQLMMAVRAVFDSWNNPRAIVYRKVNKIPDDLGTAVNVQSMAFGNMGNDSGTGVLFTRDPNTGEKAVYGEYLLNAQGEDVVAGIRTPKPIAELRNEIPDVYRQIEEVCQLLENHYRDMQDIEFTIEKGRLYILQTRSGKRSARAAITIAVDMANEGIITREEALMRVEPEQVVRMLHRAISPTAKVETLAKGLPASPGAASGKAVFNSDRAEEMGKSGEKVVLVRPETTPDDIHGIVPAQGVLTSRGGMTCHAAIVARQMGKPCVVGCEAIKIDLSDRSFKVGDTVIREGDIITIDGATGQVIRGEVETIEPELTGELKTLLDWADEVAKLWVEANADTPVDASKAREYGAKGIGLCRTEHMFMAQDRLPVVQEMIMAETVEERRAALDKLLPMQREDFVEILRIMEGYPVTIRLLDPPLHEFLPNIEELVAEVATLRATQGDPDTLAKKEAILRKARALQEFNPMLGLRGCRLGIVYPEIYEMQARAIFEAVARLKKDGVNVIPEVMIPLVGQEEELRILREMVEKVAGEVREKEGIEYEYCIGTMIEIPRAALTADEIAKYADFFSFGTNDLTQTTFGFSRDDAEGKFLTHYVDQKILPENPFAVLDRSGVGKLIKMAVELGRKGNADLKVGICGEHGGEPSSIEFCHGAGLDYVSCSPFRVPVARLAAAQAELKNR